MNYSNSNLIQTERSYGTYDQQQPMKTFAGQPNFATQREVDHLQYQVDHLQKRVDAQYGPDSRKDACRDRCPSSAEECAALGDQSAVSQCLAMLDQCNSMCEGQKRS